MNSNKNDGITLVVLIITVIVMLIIAGITITQGIDYIDKSIERKEQTEIMIVEQAVKERYTKYLTTKDEDVLIGCDKNNISTGDYTATLTPELLEQLNIKNAKKTYKVDYKAGKVLETL